MDQSKMPHGPRVSSLQKGYITALSFQSLLTNIYTGCQLLGSAAEYARSLTILCIDLIPLISV